MSTLFFSFFACFFKFFSVFIIIFPIVGKNSTLLIKKSIDNPKNLCYTCIRRPSKTAFRIRRIHHVIHAQSTLISRKALS